VEITMTQTAAAARPRTLSCPQTADWYAPTQAPTMRDRSVLIAGRNDNSINLPTAGVVGFGAAKQAAPPRGVPR
jgi:hypothetical protein